MKQIALLFLFLFGALQSKAQYDHQNISLLGLFDDPSVVAEPVYGIRYQSCYGWNNPISGEEYGIIGSTAGTYIVNVTNPAQPVLSDYIPGRQSDCIWHEYKTYGNYLYIISDDAGNNSLQIADLQYLPDSVHVVYDGTSVFVHSHTLYVDGNKLYVASVSDGSSYSSMNVYSLATPPVPVLLRRLDQDYPVINQVHDMYVIHDTVYASCANQGLHIYKFTEGINQFTELGNLTSYPDQGYNHSSFLSTDHSMLYMCDEVPAGLAVKVVDVTDVSNPTVVTTFNSNPGNTPHNPYVKDNYLFLANYQDGLYVYNLSNPSQPVLNGYFDTHPQNPSGTYPSPPYAGCWAAYADLPSGIILASDMQLGLFILDISQILSTPALVTVRPLPAFPNPASSEVHITLPESMTRVTSSQVTDLTGRLVANESSVSVSKNNASLNVENLENGYYTIRLSDGNNECSARFCVTGK